MRPLLLVIDSNSLLTLVQMRMINRSLLFYLKSICHLRYVVFLKILVSVVSELAKPKADVMANVHDKSGTEAKGGPMQVCVPKNQTSEPAPFQ